MRTNVNIKRSCLNCKFQCDGKKSNAVIEKVANFLRYKLYDRVEVREPGKATESIIGKNEFIEEFKKEMTLCFPADDVDAQIKSQNEAIKQLNSALNSMEHGGHLPLVEDNMISDKYINGKEPEIVDIDDLPLDACKIQYASREAGIKAYAEDYSFNIESKLFQQLTPEQQKMWRKEIEQAVISGAYSGLNLARDGRYEENKQDNMESYDVDEEVEDFLNNEKSQ